MSKIRKDELANLLDDEELGENAYILQVLSSWANLRVLDFIVDNGPSETGEISRGVNMDMRDVRELLNDLKEIGIVEDEEKEDSTKWAVNNAKLEIEVSPERIEVEKDIDGEIVNVHERNSKSLVDKARYLFDNGIL